MPLVRIENYPDLIAPNGVVLPRPPDMAAWRHRLADALAVAFVRAELEGFDNPDEICVTFGGQNIRPNNKTMMVLVEGFLVWSKQTQADFERLTQLLGETAHDHLPDDWGVDVHLNCNWKGQANNGFYFMRRTM